MYLTKNDILKQLDEQGSDCAMDIGVSIAQMDSVEAEETWENVAQATKEFFHKDEYEIKDFFMEVEEYADK